MVKLLNYSDDASKDNRPIDFFCSWWLNMSRSPPICQASWSTPLIQYLLLEASSPSAPSFLHSNYLTYDPTVSKSWHWIINQLIKCRNERAEGGDASYSRYCRYSVFNGQFVFTIYVIQWDYDSRVCLICNAMVSLPVKRTHILNT